MDFIRPSQSGSAIVRIKRFARPLLVALVCFLAFPREAPGQEPVPGSLSLEEAIQVARRNNPLLQADLNNREVADWNIKAAYGALIPSASAGSSLSWQGSGEQQVGSVTLSELGFGNQPSYYFSSYRLGVSYNLDGRILLALPQARADLDATLAQGEASQVQIVFVITQNYLEILRQAEVITPNEPVAVLVENFHASHPGVTVKTLTTTSGALISTCNQVCTCRAPSSPICSRMNFWDFSRLRTVMRSPIFTR